MANSKKHIKPSKILWVDLEMTGLDPNKDVILEIAAEITDFEFKTIGSYEACIKQPKALVVERMRKNTWWQSYPENRDAFVNGLANGKSLKEVEKEMIDLVHEHFGSEPAVLGGNSIWNDRMFIREWMPALDLKLHYRMLDVSAWKVFMQARYGVEFRKPEIHRAFEDIQGSIAELEYYLNWFKKNLGDKS